MGDGVPPKSQSVHASRGKDPEWWSKVGEERATKKVGCGCNHKGKCAGTAAAPCPHCGKSEPGSCPKCAAKTAEAVVVEQEPATAAPAQEPFVVTEDMVWHEDEL